MPLKWKKVWIADENYESAGVFDVNNDGVLDIDVRGRDDMDVVLTRLLAIADRALQRALRRRAEIDHVLDDERAARRRT